jgi:superfamily II DNA/RNA helicase
MMRYLDEAELEYLDDTPAEETEALEEEVLDSATAALTIAELNAEIETLRKLELAAYQVRHRGVDRKWEEVAAILQDKELMFDAEGRRRKLVIFSEHRDTLRYLLERIGTLFGRHDMMVHIDGSVPREERRAIEDRFRNDPDLYFLVATDAAGEGINLQRAHLMINYDLPWNPNRIEQRFGRIHRIGQTEVCHLWNLVAGETREGYVYERLLKKLETESAALEGKVFNVLGDDGLFQGTSLRKMLVEAIRYGDQPEVQARLTQAIDHAFDPEHVRDPAGIGLAGDRQHGYHRDHAHPGGDGALRRPAAAAALYQVVLPAGVRDAGRAPERAGAGAVPDRLRAGAHPQPGQEAGHGSPRVAAV